DAEIAAMRAPASFAPFTPASPPPAPPMPRAPTPMPANHSTPALPEPTPAPAPPAATPSATPPPPVLDLEVVEELRSIMGAEHEGLVRLFFEDAPSHIEALQTALAADDI